MSKNEVIKQIDPYEIAFNAERQRYEKLSQEARNLRTEIERLNKAYSELEGQKTAAATDRNAHKSKVQTLENEVKRLEQENTILKKNSYITPADYEDMKKAANQLAEKIKEMNTEKGELEKKLAEERGEKEFFRFGCGAITVAAIILSLVIGGQCYQKRSLKEEIAKYKETVETLKADNQTSAASAQKYRDDFDECINDINRLKRSKEGTYKPNQVLGKLNSACSEAPSRIELTINGFKYALRVNTSANKNADRINLFWISPEYFSPLIPKDAKIRIDDVYPQLQSSTGIDGLTVKRIVNVNGLVHPSGDFDNEDDRKRVFTFEEIKERENIRQESEVAEIYELEVINIGCKFGESKDIAGYAYLIFSKTPNELRERINGLKKDGRIAEAVKIAGDVSKVYSKDPIARNFIGLFLWDIKDYKGSLREFKRAVELKPTSATYNFNLGDTYLDLKDYPNAVRYLQKANELDKTNAQYKQRLEAAKQQLSAKPK